MNISHTLLLLAIGGAVGMSAGSPPRAETVRELVLVDGQGRPRARLGITGGQPLLELLDAAGRKRAAFGLLPEGNGAALGLMNSSGDYPRVELRAEDPGEHGPVDHLVFRDDGPSEGRPVDDPVRTAIELGHGGFGRDAELILDGGEDSLWLGTFPFAGITVRGREERDGPAYVFQVGRGTPSGRLPSLRFGAGAQQAELELAPDRVVARLRSGEEELERTVPEDH